MLLCLRVLSGVLSSFSVDVLAFLKHKNESKTRTQAKIQGNHPVTQEGRNKERNKAPTQKPLHINRQLPTNMHKKLHDKTSYSMTNSCHHKNRINTEQKRGTLELHKAKTHYTNKVIAKLNDTHI